MTWMGGAPQPPAPLPAGRGAGRGCYGFSVFFSSVSKRNACISHDSSLFLHQHSQQKMRSVGMRIPVRINKQGHHVGASVQGYHSRGPAMLCTCNVH
ncbi:hypothetical protein DUNSADRAFT_4300 [Dunaliella salina]|uniref:Encoded protein n=1 Tax=Dunaliella salina TaxID=3046 RepID=A0ABQ7FVF0_DUNSA|nr:hypothetical protein DUNSADRAFT_4300 [Dunaliella salina]|eukprot:KAF5826181.1 hypothetical protein DUNSADRAFT_4300 [Dunaliella salina]